MVLHGKPCTLYLLQGHIQDVVTLLDNYFTKQNNVSKQIRGLRKLINAVRNFLYYKMNLNLANLSGVILFFTIMQMC